MACAWPGWSIEPGACGDAGRRHTQILVLSSCLPCQSPLCQEIMVFLKPHSDYDHYRHMIYTYYIYWYVLYVSLAVPYVISGLALDYFSFMIRFG